MSRYVAFDIETAPASAAYAREMVRVEAAETIRDLLDDGEAITPTQIKDRLARAGILEWFKFGARNKPESLLKFFRENLETYAAKVTKACSLDPLRGRIVSAAFYFDSAETGPQSDVACINDDVRGILTEADLVRWIWQTIALFSGVVTFNGVNFDVPFLQKRSAILSITPTRDLDTRRYTYAPNCDVMQWLANWNSHQMVSLERACQAFGIDFVKGTLTGANLHEYVEDKRWDEITQYNLADVQASLWPLYLRCRDHISGHADPQRIKDARVRAVSERHTKAIQAALPSPSQS